VTVCHHFNILKHFKSLLELKKKFQLQTNNMELVVEGAEKQKQKIRACEGCHEAKRRCEKDPQAKSCLRCIKQNLCCSPWVSKRVQKADSVSQLTSIMSGLSLPKESEKSLLERIQLIDWFTWCVPEWTSKNELSVRNELEL
jgi:hypothetical protein